MTDPLSIAAGAAGLLSLGIQVTQSLIDYYTAYKHQDASLASAVDKLEGLHEFLVLLDQTLGNRRFNADEQSTIRKINDALDDCDESIHELRDECQKLTHDQSTTKPTGGRSDRFKSALKRTGVRLAYPFRESTLQRIEENISEIRANLSFALDVLQLRDNQQAHDEMSDIKTLISLVHTLQISSAVRDWLKAPDATINHSAACAKKHPGTGQWLINSGAFDHWLNGNNTFLWLNGFAGCGKSVLCSTAIQHTFRNRSGNSRIGIAYFYFTFNDESKQDAAGMLRSLLLQLSAQLSDGHVELEQLRTSCSSGTPSVQTMLDYLHHLIGRYEQVYVLLDALDESPRDTARTEVLETLHSMRQWLSLGLHLLVTSRDEVNIREELDPSSDEDIMMKNDGINQDIANFVSQKLVQDRRLKKWQIYQEKIQTAFAERAQGVFRWVECQFQSLRSCPCSEDHLDRLLGSLPRSLDETYERMLRDIDADVVEDARRILTLLCFAPRPMTVPELIEGLAVEIEGTPGLNRKRRLQGPDDIRGICPNLIEVGIVENDDEESDIGETDYDGKNEIVLVVRIAHFSVQEYLVSGRMRDKQAARFGLVAMHAHAEIAKICLVYLLEPELSRRPVDLVLLSHFALAYFAARYWHHHLVNATDQISTLIDTVLKLFEQQDRLQACMLLYSADNHWRNKHSFRELPDTSGNNIYYSAFLGLEEVVRKLLDQGADVHARGGHYNDALQAASVEGHEKVVQILLQAGADVNAQGSYDRTALLAASSGGYEKIVQILLQAGANVNVQGGYYSNALQAASVEGHEKVVQILLQAGADVNAQGGDYGTALQTASYKGQEKIVQMLLQAGADVNVCGDYNTALQAASVEGHEKIVQILLQAGADVNAHGGYYDTALRAASIRGYGVN